MAYSYRELVAWQKARELAREIYRATDDFPAKELYGLTSQMRRAAVSIPSNIAEGQGRNTRGEFHQFLGHARGSLLELETQLQLAADLGFLSADRLQELNVQCAEVLRVLNGLLESMRKAAGAGG